MKGILATVLIAVILIGIGFFVFTGGSDSDIDVDINNSNLTQNQTGTDNEPSDSNDSDTGATPQTHAVEIKGYAYKPATLTIKVGDTVTWTNKDNVRHTVTSDSGNELDSEYFATDQTYSHTFTKAGTYKYHCAPHPNMKATVVVE